MESNEKRSQEEPVRGVLRSRQGNAVVVQKEFQSVHVSGAGSVRLKNCAFWRPSREEVVHDRRTGINLQPVG